MVWQRFHFFFFPGKDIFSINFENWDLFIGYILRYFFISHEFDSEKQIRPLYHRQLHDIFKFPDYSVGLLCKTKLKAIKQKE